MALSPATRSLLRDAALAALVVMGVGILVWWIPLWWGIALVSLGLLIWGLRLYFHPARWYRRLTGAALGAWIVHAATPSFRVLAQGFGSTIAIRVDGADWALHLAFAVAFVGSLAVTAWKEHQDRVAQHPVAPDAPATTDRSVQQAPGARQPIQIINPQQPTIYINSPATHTPPSTLPAAPTEARQRLLHQLVSPPAVTRHFLGRNAELAQLQQAMEGPAAVICVVGMAGQGKSALLGAWYQEQRERLEGTRVFWCRPYDIGYSFARFLTDILDWLLGDSFDPRQPLEAQVQMLSAQVQQEPVLIVLDGMERWLHGWVARPEAEAADVTARDRDAAEPACDHLLAAATLWTSGARLLLATRALPRVLDERPCVTIGQATAHGDRVLAGLRQEDGVQLLQRHGVRCGDTMALDQVVAHYAGHAYALSVLGSMVRKQYGGVWEDAAPVLGPGAIGPGVTVDQRLRRLLAQALAHRQADHALLTWVAVSVAPPPVAMLVSLEQQDEPQVRARLADLQDWHLVDFNGQTLGMHALLQHHVREGLTLAERHQRAQQIATWCMAQPLPARPQSLTDLQPRLWGVQQMLAVDDPVQAATLLSQQVEQERLLTLDAWLNAFGHHAMRLDFYTALCAGYQRLVKTDGRHELRNDLASVYNNRGLAYQAQGDLERALADYAQALALYQRLVETDGRHELRNDLAMVYNNRGLAYRAQGDLERALADYAQALALRQHLVETDGRHELVGDLAGTLCNRGLVRLAQQEWVAAREDLDAGVRLLHQAVQQGRLDLLPNLVRNVATCVLFFDRLNHPEPVVSWLTDLATWLATHAAQSRGYTVWRREVARLAACLAPHQALLTAAGVNLSQLRQAMAPYLDDTTALGRTQQA